MAIISRINVSPRSSESYTMPDDEKHVFETRHLDSTATARALTSRDGTSPLDPGLPWVVEFRVVGSPATVQLRL